MKRKWIPIVILGLAGYIALRIYGVDTGSDKSFFTYMVGVFVGGAGMGWLAICEDKEEKA